jgi:hypothetical protein
MGSRNESRATCRQIEVLKISSKPYPLRQYSDTPVIQPVIAPILRNYSQLKAVPMDCVVLGYQSVSFYPPPADQRQTSDIKALKN